VTALEDAQTVLTLIEKAGPVDSEQIRVMLAWKWHRYCAAMRKLKYYDLAYCDHDDGRRWKLGQERVVRVRRPTMVRAGASTRTRMETRLMRTSWPSDWGGKG